MTSSGSLGTAGVAGSPYTIIATQGSLTALATAMGWRVEDTGTLAVHAAPVTVTALRGTTVYGSSPTNPGLSATGLQNGQTLSVLGNPSNSWHGPTTGVAGSPYTLTVAGLLTNPNYRVTSINGSWIVTPELITVTADNWLGPSANRNPPLTFEVTGGALQNGDMFAGQLATAATSTSLAGLYSITQGTLALSRNYDLTFVDGVLLVSPPPVNTASADKYVNLASVRRVRARSSVAPPISRRRWSPRVPPISCRRAVAALAAADRRGARLTL